MKRLILIVVVVLMSSSIATAQDFCKGDFDYDANVDADDVTTFLEHFGRSIFNNPCPLDGPAPVERTGQTISYATGDDGDLERGVRWPNPRFTDNGNGTVTDNLTGLIWLKDANCFGTRTWNDALSDSNGLVSGTCGLTDGSSAGDWRLPNYKELFSLVDAENSDPALPSGHPFTNVQSNYYWSSTTLANFSDGAYAWYVNIPNGYVHIHGKTTGYSVWPVRGGYVPEGCNEPSSLEARGGSCIFYFTLSASYYCSDYTGSFFDFETGAAKCADRLDTSGGVLDPSYSTLSCSERAVEIEASIPGYMGLTGHCVIHCQEENEFIWNIYTSNPASACTGFDFFTPEQLDQ